MRRTAEIVAAVLVAVAVGLSAGAARAQPRGKKEEPKNDDLARARALDKEGAKAYGEGRYNDAIRYFEEAHRLGGPAFELWNVAKCHLRLDQPEQAAEKLEKYLATPSLPKEDREEANQQLAQLKKRTSTLTVSSTPTGAQVSVDGKTIEGRTPLSSTIGPGEHTIVVSSPKASSFSQTVEARYGRAVIVDATLPEKDVRPPPPPNPYDQPAEGPITLRGAIGLVFTRHGSIGGNAAIGVQALGTYRIVDLGRAVISAGGLVSVSGDAWANRTGVANETPKCGTFASAQSATPLSLFAIATAGIPVHPKVRVSAIGGVGLAAYLADKLGGDLFVPTCDASPGVRPALLLGAEIDYHLTPLVRLSAFPLTWHVQPAFDGTRDGPRDASGLWMRFGIGIGAGVDL